MPAQAGGSPQIPGQHSCWAAHVCRPFPLAGSWVKPGGQWFYYAGALEEGGTGSMGRCLAMPSGCEGGP